MKNNISFVEQLEERLFLSSNIPLGVGSSANSILNRVPVSSDDYGNTIANASGVVLDSKNFAFLSGQINTTNDVDVFFLIPTKDGKLTISLSAIVNKRVSISGDLAASTDSENIARDSDATNTSASLTFDVKAGIKYYITVATLNGQTGKYNLSFSEVPMVVPAPPPVPGNYTPGTTVTCNIENGSKLVILGTDNNDSITVSRSSGNTIVYVNGELNFTNNQTFSSIEMYGFGGNDVLISVSGSKETIWGGSGFDSFWVDRSDQIGDVDATESAFDTVHSIKSFYQPLGSPIIPLELAGQKLVDPDPGVANYGAYVYGNFSQYSVFVDGPQYNDVHQGDMGDCYFMAALSSIAYSDPEVIKQMVTPFGDGTYGVRYYINGQETYCRVDGDFPTYYGSFLANAQLTPQNELWVAIAEKAYAEVRTGSNSYPSLSAGWMDTVYFQITGPDYGTSRTSVSGYNDTQLVNLISSNLSQGHPISTSSISTLTSGPIVRSHAYTIQSLTNVNGIYYITVYNVWSVDGTQYDNNPYDGLLTLTLAQYRMYFSTICVSNV